MYIAKLSLICLIAFAFMVGCGMMGKKAEMPEAATGSMEGEMMKSEAAEAKTESSVMEEETPEATEAIAEAAIEEVTLNVTGMT